LEEGFIRRLNIQRKAIDTNHDHRSSGNASSTKKEAKVEHERYSEWSFIERETNEEGIDPNLTFRRVSGAYGLFFQEEFSKKSFLLL
jgi:hypothetical protein